MVHRHDRLLTVALLFTFFVAPRPTSAQTLASARQLPEAETRQQLLAAIGDAEREHRDSEAWLLRSRLKQGDFQVGDRIVLSIVIPGLSAAEWEQEIALRLNPGVRPGGGDDTVIVRAGKLLQIMKLRNVPDFSLDGVLRSELNDTLTVYLSKYVRKPIVRAVPLLRVGVIGSVTHPGWYSTPADAVLSDVIMQAGGVGPEADIARTSVRRDGIEIWKPADIRHALSNGMSLDQLHLRAGDEVMIGERRQWSLMNTIQVVAALVGIVAAAQVVRR